MNIYDTKVVKTLLSFLPVSPVDYSVLTTFLDVCNSLVISDKKEERNVICNAARKNVNAIRR